MTRPSLGSAVTERQRALGGLAAAKAKVSAPTTIANVGDAKRKWVALVAPAARAPQPLKVWSLIDGEWLPLG